MPGGPVAARDHARSRRGGPASVLRALLSVALLVAAVAAPARAARVEVGACTLIAPDAQRRVLDRLAARAAVILPRLERRLGLRPARPFSLVLIPPGPAPDTQTAALDRSAPAWAAGWIDPARREGAIRLARAGVYPYGSLESVLAHETTHLLLHDAVGRRLPLWLEEGIATWEGRDWTLEDLWILSSLAVGGDVPALEQLDPWFASSDDHARAAYAASFSFVSWAVSRHGEELPARLVGALRRQGVAEAWRATTGVTLAEDEAAWRRERLGHYRWIAIAGSSGALWLALAGLAVIAALRRRATLRARRARWDVEERAARERWPGPEPADDEAPHL